MPLFSRSLHAPSFPIKPVPSIWTPTHRGDGRSPSLAYLDFGAGLNPLLSISQFGTGISFSVYLSVCVIISS